MEAECVEASKCPWCGYTLQSRDCKKILLGDLPSSPEGGEKITHCICYECGEEWVE